MNTTETEYFACLDCYGEFPMSEVGDDQTRPGIDPVPVLICRTCAARERITAHGEDDWECLCGNRTYLDGFYPYADGREVEPTAADWDGVHYFCGSCFRIIDQNTLAVTDRRDSVALLD